MSVSALMDLAWSDGWSSMIAESWWLLSFGDPLVRLSWERWLLLLFLGAGSMIFARRGWRVDRESHTGEDFLAVMSKANLGYALVDWPSGRFLKTNAAFAQLVGYSQPELLAMTLGQIDASSTSRQTSTGEVSLSSHNSWLYPAKKSFRRKDGSEVLIHADGQMVDEPNPGSRAWLIVRDITPEQQLESRLLHDQQQLSLTLQAAGAARWEWDIVEDVVDASDEAYRRLYGLGPSETSSVAIWLERLHPEDRPVLQRRLTHLLETPGDDEWCEEFRILHPTLGIRWVLGLGRCYRDDQGRPLRMLGVNLDITERRSLEVELEEHIQRLEAFVQDSPAATAMFDDQLRYLAASRRWFTEHQLEPRSATGLAYHEVIADLPWEWVDSYRRGLAGETIIVDEIPWERANGQRLWMRFELRPWYQVGGEIGGIIVHADNITQKKTLEAQAYRREQQLRMAFEAADIATWTWNMVENKIEDWEGRFRELYGLGPDQEPSFEHWIESLHPDDRQAVIDNNRRIFSEPGYEASTLEFRVRHPEFGYRWILAISRVHRDEEQRPIRLVGVNIDITQRKLIELALSEREQQLRVFVEYAPAALAMFDDSMCYMAASRRWVTDNFPHLKDFVGVSHYELFPDLPAHWRENNRRALAGEVIRVEEERWIRQDGLPQWSRYEVRPWHRSDGTVGGIVVLTENITERKTAEAELRRQEQQFALTVQASGAACWVWDLQDEQGCTWNLQYRELYGFSQDESATFEKWKGRIHPEDRDRVVGSIQKSAAEGREMIEPQEFRILHPMQGERWVLGMGHCFYDPSGKIERMCGVNFDITTRKMVELALEESAEQLRLFVEHAPAALAMFDRELRFVAASGRWMNSYLAEKLEVVGQLYGDICRDLPARWNDYHRRALAGEVIHIEEERWERADGVVVWLQLEMRPWRRTDGEIGGIVIQSKNLTDRKLAEEKLRESEQQLSLTLQASGAARWVWDLKDEQRNYWDPRQRELYGFSATESPSHDKWRSRVHPEDLPRMEQCIASLLKSEGEGVCQDEYRIYHPEKGLRWMHSMSSIFRDAVGQLDRVVGVDFDITERKEAELAVEESELRLLVEHAPAALAMFDEHMRYLYVSVRWQEIFLRSRKDVVGKYHYDISPECPERWRSEHRRALAGEAIHVDIEPAPWVMPDGRLIWFGYDVHPWHKLDGTIGGILIYVNDLTELKHHAEALKDLNANLEQRVVEKTLEVRLLSQAIAHLGEGVIITSVDEGSPRIVFANAAMSRISGYATEELLGQSPMLMLGEKTCHTTLQRVKHDLLAGRSASAELVHYRKDGSTYDAECFTTPMLDDAGKCTNFVSIQRDIGERKRADKALRESEYRWRAIFDTAFNPIITTDIMGLITSSNRATEKIFGFSADELTGRDLSMLLPGLVQEHDRRMIGRYLFAGEEVGDGRNLELVARRKDGSLFPVELALSRLAGGGHTGILRDLSEVRELQRHILEVAADEQRRIGQELHDGTQQELTGLSLYAGAVSEILKHAALPTETDGQTVWQMAKDDFEQLRQTVGRLNQGLIKSNRHVQDLSRGIMPVQIDSQGLVSALRELADSLKAQPGITCHFSQHRTVCISDNTFATHLYRIAQEAVTNALRHGQASEIHLRLDQGEAGVVLEVADNGRGIQAIDSLEGRPKPAGMGLRTMKYRASLMGGTLQVTARPEGGVCVLCEIPWTDMLVDRRGDA
jgi:two-component system sensor kinase FixL